MSNFLVPLQMIKKKLRFILVAVVLFLIMIKLYDYKYFTPYPFEYNQSGANSLLTDEELKKVFEKSNLNGKECSNQTKILVAINSAILNFQSRQMIRKTWAKWVQQTNQTYLFFASKPTDLDLVKQIEQENYHYNDIVLLPTRESYYLLSFKMLSALFWTTNHCSNIKFYIKCDDDMFLNWKNLHSLLMSRQNETNVIYGSIKRSNRPNRDFTSRWYVSFKDYSKNRYPDFADGPVYMMTYDLIPKFLNATSLVKPLYLEDVYITGLLREKIPEARIESIRNLISFYLLEKSNCQYRSSFSFHKIKRNQMKYLFEKYSLEETNSSFICSFLKSFL